MLKGFKRAQKIVDEAATKRYVQETPEAQLRHIRIHIAAQASQISTILTEISMTRAVISQVLTAIVSRDTRIDHIGQQLDEQLRCPHCRQTWTNHAASGCGGRQAVPE